MLLDTSEYILLRGKGNGSYPGLLHQVNTTPAPTVDDKAVLRLHMSLPRKYQDSALFLMNTVTLNKLLRTMGSGQGKLLRSQGNNTFTLMDKPVILSGAMPCPQKGSVPILYGDFSKIRIEDCGRDGLEQAPYKGNPQAVECSMTGYLNCVLEDRQAVWGMKII